MDTWRVKASTIVPNRHFGFGEAANCISADGKTTEKG